MSDIVLAPGILGIGQDKYKTTTAYLRIMFRER